MVHNLILAVIWTIVGLLILLGQPGWIERYLQDRTQLAGWVALLLAAFNFVRWFSYRSARASRRAAEQASLEREQGRGRIRHEEEPPNPDFDFGPKPPEEGPPPP